MAMPAASNMLAPDWQRLGRTWTSAEGRTKKDQTKKPEVQKQIDELYKTEEERERSSRYRRNALIIADCSQYRAIGDPPSSSSIRISTRSTRRATARHLSRKATCQRDLADPQRAARRRSESEDPLRTVLQVPVRQQRQPTAPEMPINPGDHLRSSPRDAIKSAKA